MCCESATVVMLTSVVMHSLQVSAFQTTFFPSAATCGPNRGGRCGLGNRATPGLQGGGRSGWTVQASAVGGSCRDSWRSLLCSLAEVRCSTDP